MSDRAQAKDKGQHQGADLGRYNAVMSAPNKSKSTTGLSKDIESVMQKLGYLNKSQLTSREIRTIALQMLSSDPNFDQLSKEAKLQMLQEKSALIEIEIKTYLDIEKINTEINTNQQIKAQLTDKIQRQNTKLAKAIENVRQAEQKYEESSRTLANVSAEQEARYREELRDNRRDAIAREGNIINMQRLVSANIANAYSAQGIAQGDLARVSADRSALLARIQQAQNGRDQRAALRDLGGDIRAMGSDILAGMQDGFKSLGSQLENDREAILRALGIQHSRLRSQQRAYSQQQAQAAAEAAAAASAYARSLVSREASERIAGDEALQTQIDEINRRLKKLERTVNGLKISFTADPKSKGFLIHIEDEKKIPKRVAIRADQVEEQGGKLLARAGDKGYGYLKPLVEPQFLEEPSYKKTLEIMPARQAGVIDYFEIRLFRGEEGTKVPDEDAFKPESDLKGDKGYIKNLIEIEFRIRIKFIKTNQIEVEYDGNLQGYMENKPLREIVDLN